jgi:predicted nucleotidyltransferase component of viral defense system
MPDLSEFIAFVAEKSGIKKPDLIEKDLIIQRILKEMFSFPHFSENYLFKGGSCLVKCYLGYYRFSVDLDFTWKNQKTWKALKKKELRRKLLEEINVFASFLERNCKEINLEFKNDPKDNKYFEFGGGGRMVTFKLWRNSQLIKIQVNFVEEMLFPHRKAVVKTLLDDVDITKDERAYFEEFLNFYASIKVLAYDEREILCEKVRAIFTRRTQKLRDFYDLFMLDRSGFKTERLKEEIIKKTKASLHYKKYRENLGKNRESLKIAEAVDDTLERSLLVSQPTKGFEAFLKELGRTLKNIMSSM